MLLVLLTYCCCQVSARVANSKPFGISCVVDSPDVGKHLKDHIQVPLFFSAPGVGVSMQEVAISMGPSVLRHPAGPLPANPDDDGRMSAELGH